MSSRVKRRWWWLTAGVVLLLLAVVGGPYLYIHVIEGPAPAPLTLASSTPSAPHATSGGGSTTADGTWKVASGSVVGYRVDEVLFGQSNVAVGRTDSITGSMTAAGTRVTAASFTADMTTVTSDESRRDEQFDGRIMEVSSYPTATFSLTRPIALGSIPAAGVRSTYTATGDLTLHGVTKQVTFAVAGRLSGSSVQIAGSIPITFADYGISNPSFPPVVTTEDHGLLEFSLVFTHA